MPLFTSNELLNIAESQRVTFSAQSRQMLNESKKLSPQFDIFLSHSHSDKPYAKGLFTVLTNLGYKVYVDWIVDPGLGKSGVTKKVADKVRERMNQSKCLYFASSSKSTASKWMPWESGFMDGRKDKVAIVPVQKGNVTTNRFQGVEYLSLYPYIVQHLGRLYVVESRYKYIDFDSWLKGKKPQAQSLPLP